MEQGVRAVLAPTGVAFVGSLPAVQLPATPGYCNPLPGKGRLFWLGTIPPAGDRVTVWARADSSAAIGGARFHDVQRTGTTWAVVGSTPANHTESVCG